MKRIQPHRLLMLSVIIIISVIALYPFYNMVIMGTYSNRELLAVQLLPGDDLRDNLNTVLKNRFFAYYFNSLYIASMVSVGSTLVSALAGFAFAKYRFPGKGFLFMLVLGTLMIPSQLGLVGFVKEMQWFGISNTHWPLIIPSFANAFGVYWMTQYIQTGVPNEILESSVIDGCNDFTMFRKIALPIIQPALVTLLLLFFLGSWDSYILPLVVLNKDSLYTIPLMIAQLSNAHIADNASRMLTLSLSTIPVITMFAVGSKALIRGFTVGGLKES